jgi:pimeloyl-ACP methyl ester carboxylesterase
MRVSVSGVSVSYDEAGEGDAVLLLHGSGPGVSAQANWSRTLESVAKLGYRAIAPDIVGFGDSDRPTDFPYGASGWAQNVRGFLYELGIESAHVVGNSMGGRIALTLAARSPQLIRTLTLMGVRAPGTAMAPGLVRARTYTPSLQNMRTLLTESFVVDPSLITDELVERRHEASTRPGAAEHYRHMFADPAANDLPLTPEELRAISVPTLILHGREDAVVPVDNTYRLVELLPDVLAVIASSCGHWVHVEQVDLFEAQLAAFLARHRGRTADRTLTSTSRVGP